MGSYAGVNRPHGPAPKHGIKSAGVQLPRESGREHRRGDPRAQRGGLAAAGAGRTSPGRRCAGSWWPTTARPTARRGWPGKGGAEVVAAARRGYGSACLAGLAHLRRTGPPDIVVFIDADYSDHPEELPALVAPILAGEADLVIGSRVLGRRERGALLPQARAGNLVACLLIRLFYGHRFTDLGPFRAVRWDALERLGMADPDFGWTAEMQVKAVRRGLRCARCRSPTAAASGCRRSPARSPARSAPAIRSSGPWPATSAAELEKSECPKPVRARDRRRGPLRRDRPDGRRPPRQLRGLVRAGPHAASARLRLPLRRHREDSAIS